MTIQTAGSKAVFLRAILVVVAGFVALPVAAGDLKITIQGVHSSVGTLMIGLYDTREGFVRAIRSSQEAGLLTEVTRVAGLALRAVRGPQSLAIGSLKPGLYAVIAYHDENDDGKLNVTSWGVPSEGYGFSNNAWDILRAPSFDAAAFVVGETDKSITILLTY